MKHSVIAYDDRVLIDWLLELIEEGSPDFLAFLAEAAALASPEDYAILRPSLLLLKQRHVRAEVTMCAQVDQRVEMAKRVKQTSAQKECQT